MGRKKLIENVYTHRTWAIMTDRRFSQRSRR